MKKSLIVITVVALVAVASIGADAYGGRGQGRGGYQQGGMYGQQGGMHGRQGGRWNVSSGICPCGNYGNANTARPGGNMSGRQGNWNANRPGWNAPGQQGTVPEIISEEKAKEVADEYLKTYLSGYSIEKVEKDSWRPLYIVSLKGENDAEMQMLIHGFAGQVMHVYPKPAEAATE